MSQPRRPSGPIASQRNLIALLKNHNGASLQYLAHHTENRAPDQSLYHRLRKLESDGYVRHFVDQFGKRIIHHYYLTAKAYELYVAKTSRFKPRMLLPELKYVHDYRRKYSEKYTPSDYEHNGWVLSELFPNAEVPGEVVGELLSFYDCVGEGLSALFDGREGNAGLMFDLAMQSIMPKILGRLHAAYWANHVLMRACVEAGRVLEPGPDRRLTLEEVREGRERFRAAFDQCLQAPDVDREAFEVALRIAEVKHAQEAEEGRVMRERRISDAETIRLDDEFQAERFRQQRAERELDIELHQARQQRAETGSTFTPGPIEEDEGEPEGDQ